MKSNTDKLEALANSGKLTINRTITTEKKLTAKQWYMLFLEELVQASYDTEENLTIKDYIAIAERLGK